MNSTNIIKAKYTCSECAKTFKNIEDMHIHAEACVCEAFEMEMRALAANQSYMMAPSNEKSLGRLASDYKALFKPFGERKKKKGGLASDDDDDDDDERIGRLGGDDDAPPELELAEQPNKKYKRIFPIGEDGKQIRPRMECPTCGLILYRHNFATHYRIHTGELPFTCSFCDKRFRTSSALTVHTRCHTGDKPYECPHCAYSCITKRNLDRHIINNHVKRTGWSHTRRKGRRSASEFHLRRSARRIEEGEVVDEEEEEQEEQEDEDVEEDPIAVSDVARLDSHIEAEEEEENEESEERQQVNQFRPLERGALDLDDEVELEEPSEEEDDVEPPHDDPLDEDFEQVADEDEEEDEEMNSSDEYVE